MMPPRATLIDAHAVLHLGELLVADEAERLGVLRQVHGDEVGFAVDLVGVVGALEAELVELLCRHERVVGEHVHAETAGVLGDEEADAPQAEDAERLAAQLHAALAPLALLPAAVLEVGVRLRDVAGGGHDEGHRVLGGGEHVALRRVHDDDAALGRLGDVDVVDADAGAAHHLEVRAGPDDVRRHLRGGADDEAVVLGDAGQELVGIPVRPHVDLEALLLEERDALGGELLLDQDLLLVGHLRHPLRAARCSA